MAYQIGSTLLAPLSYVTYRQFHWLHIGSLKHSEQRVLLPVDKAVYCHCSRTHYRKGSSHRGVCSVSVSSLCWSHQSKCCPECNLMSSRNFFLHLLDQQILGKYNKLLENKSTNHTWSHYNSGKYDLNLSTSKMWCVPFTIHLEPYTYFDQLSQLSKFSAPCIREFIWF